MTSDLTLLPWQVVETPAIDAAALMIIVEFTLKPFVDMKDPGESTLKQRLARFQRTFAAAADQDHRGATLVHDTDGPP